MFGAVEPKLLKAGYFTQVAKNQYRLTVTFDKVAAGCITNSSSSTTLGDRLIVNANTIAHPIPVTEDDAVANKWHKGSCFYGMGHHYFYDLETAPDMSWKAGNVLPGTSPNFRVNSNHSVVAMYDKGLINAFFFTDTTIQQGVFNAHWWEPIPLPNYLMCFNTCDSSCHFEETNFWSTLHIYLRDYTKATCANGCSTHCCP